MAAPEAGRAGGRERELRRQVPVKQPWAPVNLRQVLVQQRWFLLGAPCPVSKLRAYFLPWLLY